MLSSGGVAVSFSCELTDLTSLTVSLAVCYTVGSKSALVVSSLAGESGDSAADSTHVESLAIPHPSFVSVQVCSINPVPLSLRSAVVRSLVLSGFGGSCLFRSDSLKRLGLTVSPGVRLSEPRCFLN